MTPIPDQPSKRSVKQPKCACGHDFGTHSVIWGICKNSSCHCQDYSPAQPLRRKPAERKPKPFADAIRVVKQVEKKRITEAVPKKPANEEQCAICGKTKAKHFGKNHWQCWIGGEERFTSSNPEPKPPMVQITLHHAKYLDAVFDEDEPSPAIKSIRRQLKEIEKGGK